MGLLWGFAGSTAVQAQAPVAPSIQEARVHILRGKDVVQVPSLWYQEGNAEPDSLGIIRIPRGPSDRSAVMFRDASSGFDVNLQHATLTNNGNVTEVYIPTEVLRGERPARFIIRPPADDFYDVTYPEGVKALETPPGEQTVIDVYDWYTSAGSRALALAPCGRHPFDRLLHSQGAPHQRPSTHARTARSFGKHCPRWGTRAVLPDGASGHSAGTPCAA